MQQEPRALDQHDFESASVPLVEAFFDNPAHVYMFLDKARREKLLAWLLERIVSKQAPLEHSFCLLEEGEQSRDDAVG